MSAENDKYFLALLNGLARMHYYDDSTISIEMLKEELYSDASDVEFNAMFQKCSLIIKSMATVDMDYNQMEIFLTSQVKKREGGISEAQAKCFSRFWKSNKSQIHETLVKSSHWGSRLDAMSWRVDMASSSGSEIGPTAIFDLKLTNANAVDESVRFETDEQGLQSLLSNVQAIEAQLTKYTQEQ